MCGFNNFYVNAYYEQTALFGGVYYVLAKQGQICQRYLDFLEKTFTKDEKLKGYFQPFKDAVKEKNQQPIGQIPQNGTDKKEAKGLTPAQAALFCEALANYHHCQVSNKKESFAPIAHGLFGWSISTIEKRLSEGYNSLDREFVGKLFESIDSDFAKHIRTFGKPSSSPNDSKTNESE